MPRFRFAPAAVAGLVLLTAGGCQDESVRRYSVPRTPEPAVRLLGAIVPFEQGAWFVKLSGPADAVGKQREAFDQFVQSLRFPKDGDDPITWTAPPGWSSAGGPRGERFATFRIEPDNLEATVTVLGRSGADLLPNVNRWRRQVGLGPLTEDALPANSRAIEVAGIKATLVDMTGPADAERARLLAAAAEGNPKLQARPDAPTPASPPTAAGGLKYDVPPGWTEIPASGMRVAAFRVGSGGRTAEVTVIPLSGPAGGLADNINRWRNEVGLKPQSAEEAARDAKTVDLGGARASIVDLAGTTERTLGAIVPQGERTWFVKLRGPTDVVGPQQAAFETFVKSIRFRPEGSR